MTFVKNRLRLSRDALDKKDYTGAKEAALEVLDYEPSNYHAHVFLGLASLELGEYNKSEQAYRKAIEIQKSQPLAWMGLSRLLERTEQWPACVKSLYELANVQCSQFIRNDAVRCGETMQKIIDVCRTHHDRPELIDALCHLLPNSPFYHLLSTLPEPDNSSPSATTTISIQRAIYESLPVLEEIMSLIESYEEDTINREIQTRRTRLGAPNLEQLQNLVGQEVWSSSRLPEIYTEIMNHPGAADNLRRDVESKLLRYKYRYLCSLPNVDASLEAKQRTLRDVNELVGSAILLKIPDELAWNLSLEHQESESIATCDRQLLHDFVELFPHNPVARLLKHLFLYMGLRLSDVETGHDVEEPGKEECYNIILDAHSEVPDHILANRALAEVYLKELDYEGAIRIADYTLLLLKKREGYTSVRLYRTTTGIKAIKATSLVHLFPPKHHGLASVIIDDVLSCDPNNTSCLLGKAFVLQSSERWQEARTHFLRVASLLSEDDFNRLRSIEEAAWCQFQSGQHEEGLSLLQHAFSLLQDLPCREADRARCLWRMGQCQWATAVGNREESYCCFIASLKQDPAYAPAYTSLGTYYTENIPPDPVRASKCFQKAFELDPREAEAARMLAQGFAEDQDWDLVEVVARRTIEGEGGLSGGLPLQSSYYNSSRPTNSWAWKAIGIVELSRGKYAEAIKAFQTSLITNANHGSLWLKLGEAYSKAGRHAAALKAFYKAKEFEPDEWLCSYFISEVKRQMGEFQEAIDVCTDILTNHPDEPVVQVSLMQSHFDLGCLEQLEGFQERAEESFLIVVKLALQIVQGVPGTWVAFGCKLIGDALFYLSRQAKYRNDMTVRNTLREVIQEFSLNREDDDVVPRPDIVDGLRVSWDQVLAGALIAYHYRLSMASPGNVSSSHWYDVGVGLQEWASKTGNVSEEIATKISSYLRQTLQESPRDAQTWAALGTFYFLNHATLAQHAYIMSLEIDSKNAVNWNNLGFLYLHHGDYKLASESFTRAQTLDPDNAISWIGQALQRHKTGLESEAQELLAHAIALGSTKPEVSLRFAHVMFQQHLKLSDPLTSSHHLISAFFALHSYCSWGSEDAFPYHLFGLVNESLEKLELAETLVENSTSLLEVEYEDTEDPVIERQFVLANSSLARLRLARQDLAGAVDSFQSVLGLLTRDGDAFTVQLRVHAHLGFGLAKFLSGEIDLALESFRIALEGAGDDLLLRSHAIILLSQVMWTIGSEDFREIAKSQLLQCIAADAMNLTAIKTLTAMGILSDDENLIDAALSELLDVPGEQRQELDPSNDVNYLLIHYHLGKGDVKKAFMFAQRALHVVPSNVTYRMGLATMMIQYGAPQNVLALLSVHIDIPQEPQLLSEMLCLLAIAYILGDSTDGPKLGLRYAQKAVMTLPSSKRSWQALGFVRSQAQQYISMQT